MKINDRFVDSVPRILGVDIENGPRWYGPGDYTYPIIFHIAWKWEGTPDDDVQSVCIDWRASKRTIRTLCKGLYADLTDCDAILGHNLSHDISGLQGFFRDIELPFLPNKTRIDTLKDIPRHQGASKSLEQLCKEFDLGEKPHLTMKEWCDALWCWRPDALEKVRHRNEMDVILTERLYRKEKELGWL